MWFFIIFVIENIIVFPEVRRETDLCFFLPAARAAYQHRKAEGK